IDGGRIIYDGKRLESYNMQGKIGNSSFSDYSHRIDWEKEPVIDVQSGKFYLVMDEIYPWLASYESLADDSQDIQNISGIAEISVKSIKGPLLQPKDLDYDVQGVLKGIALATPILPAPLNIKSGRINIVPDRIIFEDFKADLLDSLLTFSGVLKKFITGRTSAEVIVTDAILGHEFHTWLVREIDAPEEYQLRSPLNISRANAKWINDELLDLQGDFSLKEGPIFSIDIMLNPKEMVLRNLTLQNGSDRATIALELGQRKIGARFKGSLSKKTIDAILLHNDAFPDAWLKGDIMFRMDMDSIAASAAFGMLDGGDFIFPWQLEKPLLLDSFSLSAAGKTLTINSAEALFAEKIYAINGTASLTGKGLAMDLDVNTDAIELEKILATIPKEDEKEFNKGQADNGKRGIAVYGSINLQADSLHYKDYTWEPFTSLITFANSSLGIQVLEAELCQIKTPGNISFKNNLIALDFKIAAEAKEFSEVLLCLAGGEKQITGVLELQGVISGQGTRDELLNSLAGSLSIKAKEGYIYKDAQLAKLLSFLNVTAMFKGQIPDLRTKGFHYDSLVVRGTMEQGILTVAPARIDAPAMEIAAHGTVDIPRQRINLLVLVAPLQTVNRLQKMLPIIGKIVPESIIAVPAEITGDFTDIKVRPLSMSAFSRSIFGTMVNILTTPLRVLEGSSE
ncbi:MAG: AsmA-like C-terminal region-containing protein, partial [Desulfobulbales bacterium]|nr:AsmA-like C-terminal region-containing protein [Desulfobulbales bacterium]